MFVNRRSIPSGYYLIIVSVLSNLKDQPLPVPWDLPPSKKDFESKPPLSFIGAASAPRNITQRKQMEGSSPTVARYWPYTYFATSQSFLSVSSYNPMFFFSQVLMAEALQKSYRSLVSFKQIFKQIFDPLSRCFLANRRFPKVLRSMTTCFFLVWLIVFIHTFDAVQAERATRRRQQHDMFIPCDFFNGNVFAHVHLGSHSTPS
jgi:hypothetical protein